jgi:hypothetical protein
MEIARGCIFSCAYCHFDLIGKRIGDWTKNPETIKEEMIRNYELYGTTHYMFSDELINESLPKLDFRIAVSAWTGPASTCETLLNSDIRIASAGTPESDPGSPISSLLDPTSPERSGPNRRH